MQLIRRFLFAVLCAALAPALVAQQATLPAPIQRIVDGHRLPHDSYSLVVQDIDEDTPVLAVNPVTPRNPASVIKTLTTLAALEVLGPTYTWRTDVYLLGAVDNGVLHGDLLLRGGGDPYLLTEDFWNLLRAVRRIGIDRIAGDLLIDNTYFADAGQDPSGFDGQGSRAYNVVPDALLINFQTVRFYFYPAAADDRVIIRSDPDLGNLRIDNRLTLGGGNCSGYQRGIAFDTAGGSADQIVFSGKYPKACGEYSLVRSVLDPSRYAYGLFTQLWRELGGEFNGKLKLATAPAGETPVLSWSSPPMADVITSINKYSNNVMTRHLLLTLAAERFGTPATVENGARAIEDYLALHGIDGTGLVIANGSGLARETRITAALLIGVLRRGASIPYMPEYVSSLSIGGLDGTMRQRFAGTEAAGNMHIKTGTLDGASAIAGYVNAKSGRRFAVAGLLNHPLAHRGPGEELMNSLLQWTYSQ